METPKEGKKQLKISTINGEEEAHSQYAMQLVSGSVLPMVLKAAIEFGVLDIIHRDCPGALLSPSQIASQLRSLHNPDCSLTLRSYSCHHFCRHHLKDAVLLGGLPFSALKDCGHIHVTISAGIEHTAGDMFVRIPKGNAIFMKFDVYLMNTNAMEKESRENYKSLGKEAGFSDIRVACSAF